MRAVPLASFFTGGFLHAYPLGCFIFPAGTLDIHANSSFLATHFWVYEKVVGKEAERWYPHL